MTAQDGRLAEVRAYRALLRARRALQELEGSGVLQPAEQRALQSAVAQVDAVMQAVASRHNLSTDRVATSCRIGPT